MGWDYQYRRPASQGGNSLKADVKALCHESENRKVLDVAIVNRRTAYVAYQIEPGDVMCLVFLLDFQPKEYFNFGYKSLDETQGPYECDCPKRILNLLTSTDNVHANEWRTKCQENVERRRRAASLKHGDMIQLHSALTFTDGVTEQTFQVCKVGRKVRFARADGRECMITKWKTRPFTKLERTIR